MEYKVAKSYESYKKIGEPYKKDGRMYTMVEAVCDRCSHGIYVCRVENGKPVPHPAYGGICLKCGGTGFLRKEVRLYTDKEMASMEKAAQRRAEANERARLERVRRSRETWNERNGFNEEGFTYIVYGNTYPIKDELKEKGFKFSPKLKWHGPGAVDVPSDCGVEKVSFDSLYYWESGMAEPFELEGSDDFLDEIFSRTFTSSEYMGEMHERLRDLDCILTNVSEYESRYGHGYCYTFKCGENYLCTFTQRDLELEPKEEVMLTGTVKDHKIYKGNKTTYLNRCVVKIV